MSYYIHVTDAAERDIQEAYDYIDLTLKNPTAADFLTESVGTSLQKLDRFPNQNPVVHDPFLYGLGIHFIIVQNYMAFYQIEEPAQVVHILRFLFGIQVIEIAEELVEAMDGGQVLVLVAQVVLAELAGGVAQRLEQFGDGGVLGLQADVGAGHTDLGQAGAVRVLARQEGGAAGGAALLAVGVGEAHPLVGDAVDVGRAIAHQAVAVTAQVGDADVIAPDHQDIGFAFGHGTLSVLV